MGFEAGGRLAVVLYDKVAEEMDVRPLDRVTVKYNNRKVVAIVITTKMLPEKIVGVYDEVARALGVREGDELEISPAKTPESIFYIRKKLARGKLSEEEIRAIISDVVDGYLSDVELTALVTAVHFQGLSIEETLSFTKAMVDTGEKLDLKSYVKGPVLDKHSMGGVPGDKTSLILVPIIASLGYYIPKTSSRAITSAAGTADRMEALAPVTLGIEEMRKIVLREKGCIVWGGTLGLAPADDIIIRVEYPLGIDPFFIPSILAKKLAVGSTHVVLDVPVGRGAKVGTIGEARNIAREFVELSRRLSLRLEAAITYGEEPIGYTIGPALEAREALRTLMGKGPKDLIDKALSLAEILLSMIGIKNGKELARTALETGKAERKMRSIIEAQGGDPDVKPEDIPLGDKTLTLYAENEGVVVWINNSAMSLIGKTAGAPRDKSAGVELYVKRGDKIKKGQPILTVYSESSVKLQAVERLVRELNPIVVGKGYEMQMVLEKVPAYPQEKPIGLER